MPARYGSKGGGFFMLNSYSPSVVCPSAQVTFDYQIPADIDSFIVSYGPNPTDTIKNRTTFQLTAPSSSGSWTITATVYVCGSQNQMPNVITISSSPASTPLSFTASPFYVCPGSTVTLSADPATLAGITSLSINIIDPNSTIAHTATSFPVSWTVPPTAAAGTYSVIVTATYGACGSVSQPYSGMFEVYGSSSLTAPNIFGPPDYCPGTETIISLAPTQGLLSVDIGNDGTWDYVGVPFGSFRHTFATIPTGGVPIKVRQDVGCFNREDVLTWNPSNTTAKPQINSMYNGFWCPGGTVKIYGFASNFTVGAPGNYITWQASWLGGTFYGTRIDTTLPAPTSAGTHTITATVHNGCGSALQPYTHQLTTPSVFPTFPTIIGAACPITGGVVRITFPSYTLADSIRYYLPNGNSVTLMLEIH